MHLGAGGNSSHPKIQFLVGTPPQWSPAHWGVAGPPLPCPPPSPRSRMLGWPQGWMQRHTPPTPEPAFIEMYESVLVTFEWLLQRRAG